MTVSLSTLQHGTGQGLGFGKMPPRRLGETRLVSDMSGRSLIIPIFA